MKDERSNVGSGNAGAHLTRRRFIRAGIAAGLGAGGLSGLISPGVRSAAWAAGSDAPELAEVKVGFMPLTDCASVVVASEMGFDRKYGLKITPTRESSWAAVRDKLVNGEIHGAHVLYGLIYGVQLGIAGPKQDMAVLMCINNNGQGITLANHLRDKGVTSGPDLARLIEAEPREYTFAQTFPTGTHAMWLYYWLASHGVNPFKDVKTITVPPPEMVANMRAGNMDGYSAGEPWNAHGIFENTGFSVATSQDVWPDHPEKVLGTTLAFVQKFPNTARAMTAAVLEAAKHIDAMENRTKVAQLIAQESYVNADVAVIEGRFKGEYTNGLGKSWKDPNYMRFYNDGQVSFPYLSDGMWFMTQHRRWGLLRQDVDYLAVAKQVNQIELYGQAAEAAGVAVPASPMRTSRLMDGAVWDGTNPVAYANAFDVRAA